MPDFAAAADLDTLTDIILMLVYAAIIGWAVALLLTYRGRDK